MSHEDGIVNRSKVAATSRHENCKFGRLVRSRRHRECSSAQLAATSVFLSSTDSALSSLAQSAIACALKL